MKKKKVILLVFVLIVSILLVLTNFYTIKVLSAVRALITAESEYSKGQKDASLFLATYVQTENPEYWLLFKKSIDIPKGGIIAGTSLTNNDKDEVTRKGFLMGKNDPDDISEMIWLYKTFHSTAFMRKAVDLWALGTPLINKLDTIGENINADIQKGNLSAKTKFESLTEINLISSRLSKTESAFSRVLGEAAREIRDYLQYANIILILLLLGIIALYAVNMVNSLSVVERALQIKVSQLHETNEELEHFTYAASHDLQEPLRMVSGFLGLLQKKYEGKLDEQAQSYIHFAVDGASRMKMLINDLLEYSRTSVSEMAFEKVNLNKIVTDIKVIFKEHFNENGSGISISFLPELAANKIQMQQIFQNLIGNAIKYRGEAAPQIHIDATSNDTHWVFSIKDNGQGIDPRHFERIFVIFQRLHSNSTHKGTGIGLAICKKIAERHSGDIWIESEVGKGSTFFFTVSKQLKTMDPE